MKLMIVEDNDQMRRLIKSIVARLADAVYECSDGSEALAVYAIHHPDWVLMDLEMPVMDGITATRQIKAAFPDAHICIVTQHNDAQSREAAFAAGADEYVIKDDLVAVRRVLSRDQ